MIIGYVIEGSDEVYYDFDTIKVLLNTNKSKLHRTIKKYKLESIKYKNQHLYKKSSYNELASKFNETRK